MNLFQSLDRISQLRSDPVGFARQAGYNIPNGITNPQQMLQHLLQSGQVPQARFNQAQNLASMFFRR